MANNFICNDNNFELNNSSGNYHEINISKGEIIKGIDNNKNKTIMDNLENNDNLNENIKNNNNLINKNDLISVNNYLNNSKLN